MSISKMRDEKRRYKQCKHRISLLPVNYRTAVEALERYMMRFGPMSDGEHLVSMLDDLVDLFEQSAANGTSIRDVVGEDPVEFAENFIQNYSAGQWITKERARLIETIDRVAGPDAGAV